MTDAFNVAFRIPNLFRRLFAEGAFSQAFVPVLAATPVLLNVAMIAAAWLGAPWFKAQGIEPVYALGAGVMLGGALQLAVQVPALLRLGLLPKIGFNWALVQQAWADPATKNIARLMLPALLGVSVAQISL